METTITKRSVDANGIEYIAREKTRKDVLVEKRGPMPVAVGFKFWVKSVDSWADVVEATMYIQNESYVNEDGITMLPAFAVYDENDELVDTFGSEREAKEFIAEI